MSYCPSGSPFQRERTSQSTSIRTRALEVFIANILDQVAAKHYFPGDLWSWISRRGDNLRDPTPEEQLDVLQKHVKLHSLKDDAGLWESFKHLRTARKSFVHAGR